MKTILVSCLGLFLVFIFISSAHAHSTKGRVKVLLDKKTLIIDDIAYFAESYVHRHLYKNRYEKSDKRFYVNKFISIKQDKGTAVISFKTLDVKTKEIFEDKMTINRQDNGIWVLMQNTGERLEIYTYITKSAYYYDRFIFPISAAGLGLALLGFGLIRIKKNKNPA